MSQPRNSEKARTICFETHRQEDAGGIYMVCHCCDTSFNPATTKWRADHIRRHAEGGKETPENLWPIIEAHDAGPGGKAAKDNSAVAKGKAWAKKHYGISQKSGFRKPPLGMEYDWKARRYVRRET